MNLKETEGNHNQVVHWSVSSCSSLEPQNNYNIVLIIIKELFTSLSQHGSLVVFYLWKLHLRKFINAAGGILPKSTFANLNICWEVKLLSNIKIVGNYFVLSVMKNISYHSGHGCFFTFICIQKHANIFEAKYFNIFF